MLGSVVQWHVRRACATEASRLRTRRMSAAKIKVRLRGGLQNPRLDSVLVWWVVGVAGVACVGHRPGRQKKKLVLSCVLRKADGSRGPWHHRKARFVLFLSFSSSGFAFKSGGRWFLLKSGNKVPCFFMATVRRENSHTCQGTNPPIR